MWLKRIVRAYRAENQILPPTVIDEHFVPHYGLDLAKYIEIGDLGGVHHLIRYSWAVRVLADLPIGATVLDIACGSGYGSHLIAKTYPHLRVVGADYDQSAVSAARAAHLLPNLEFKFGDVTSWEDSIGPVEFDCIVSFDTIEHVEHRELMMESLVRHLRNTGCLLFSTPCGSAINNLHPSWRHHHLEYSTASLYDFLRRYFGEVIGSDTSGFPHLDEFDQLKGTGISYLLLLNPVVCRNPILIENPYHVTARAVGD